ncbi:MAG: acyltransferase [Oscillibacter sp.]|jgi:surface polysaccharide O-acyltransferase-like enzyme|nr:acyltransferase [Oscillibacter sp.]
MKRVRELDTVRVLAMFAIILLHVTAPYTALESRLSVGGMNLAFLLNQAVRFAVPMFLFLSGVVLGLLDREMRFAPFWKRRLTKIILPYLFWCAVYCAQGTGFENISASGFVRGVVLGRFAPHLYFVVVILQLYLVLFPLRRLLKTHRGVTLTVCAAVTLFFLAAITLRQWGISLLPASFAPYAWICFPTWLFYFAAGLSMGKERLQKAAAFGKKYFVPLLAVTILLIVPFAWCGRKLGTYASSARPEILLWMPVVFLLFLGAAGLVREGRWLDRGIAKLSACSYTVYLSHVFFLVLLRRTERFDGGMRGMLALFLCTCAVSIGFSLLVQALSDWLGNRKERKNAALV